MHKLIMNNPVIIEYEYEYDWIWILQLLILKSVVGMFIFRIFKLLPSFLWLD